MELKKRFERNIFETDAEIRYIEKQIAESEEIQECEENKIEKSIYDWDTINENLSSKSRRISLVDDIQQKSLKSQFSHTDPLNQHESEHFLLDNKNVDKEFSFVIIVYPLKKSSTKAY